MDFRTFRFQNNLFRLVVFDPPSGICRSKFLARKIRILPKTETVSESQQFDECSHVYWNRDVSWYLSGTKNKIATAEVLKTINARPASTRRQEKQNTLDGILQSINHATAPIRYDFVCIDNHISTVRCCGVISNISTDFLGTEYKGDKFNFLIFSAVIQIFKNAVKCFGTAFLFGCRPHKTLSCRPAYPFCKIRERK